MRARVRVRASWCEKEREEGYRRLWKEEESRVKVLTEETKSRLKIVRDHLIGSVRAHV